MEEKEKYDNPMARDMEEAAKMKDPALGYVPYTRMLNAIDQTIARKDQLRMQNAQRATGSDPSSNYSGNPTPGFLQTPPLNWIERGPVYDSVGPSNGNTRGGANTLGGHTSGRMRAILVDTLNDPTGNTVFVGSVGGGLWKCTNFLSTIPNWAPIDDRFNNISISSICQDPTNASIIYFSTGEPTDNGDRITGMGVWKSTNAGASFTQLPATLNFTRCFKVGCDASGNVYLACRITTIPVVQNGGLFRSMDGGASWTDITPNNLDPNSSNSCTDFEFTTSGILNAMFGYRAPGNKVNHRYSLTPTTVTPGTWLSSTGFRNSNTDAIRCEMAVSGNILYAVTITTAYNTDSCYKSINGGVTWTKQNTTVMPGGLGNGQGWYSISLAINPGNTAEVISGGLDCYRSTNSGSTWTKFTNWTTPQPYVHADHHFAMYWITGGQTRMYLGTDGGIFYSSNNGSTFSSKNRNLGIKQFYSAAIHPAAGSVYAIAGAQDNGVHQLKNLGLSYSFEVTGGDGMIVHINQANPNIQFGSYVYNDYRISTNGGNTWSTRTLSSSQGLFTNPFDNDDAQNIMYCSNGPLGNLRRWTGNTAGTTNSTITLPIGATTAIYSLKVSPYTANRLFIGTNDGKLYRIENANTITSANAAANTTSIGDPSFPAGTIVCVNTGTDDNNLIVTFSNFGVNNVWITNNGGTSWTAIDGNLPDMPVRWALFEPGRNNRIYLATEAGIYTTEAINGASTNWVPETTFPTVSTYMMKLRTSDSTIVVGTHGRGLWTGKILPCKAATVATAPNSPTVCVGQNANFSIAVDGTNVTYQWQVSTDGGANFSDIPAANSSTLTINSITAAMNGYQYRVNLDGTCTPPFASAPGILTVKTAASVSSQPSNQAVCAGANVSFTFGITGSTDNYQWQVSTDGGNTFNDIPGATGATLTLNNVTASMDNYMYQCIVNTPCSGQLTSNRATLNVNPIPTVNAVSNLTLCNNTTQGAVSFSGSVPGTVYSWTNNNTSIGLAASGTGNIPSFTATNAGLTPAIATITVTPSYTHYGVTCTGTPSTFTITVNPTPSVNAISNQVVCNGGSTAAVTLTSPNSGGTITYTWNHTASGIGLANNGVGNIPSFTAINNTNAPIVATIFVIPSFTNNGVTCVGSPRQFTITVNPTPTVNAVTNQTVCNNASTAAISFSGFVAGTVYNWTNNTTSIGLAASGTGTIGSFTAVNTTAAPVTATITVTPSYTNAGVTCTGAPVSFTITVNPTPTVNAVANVVVCNGANTNAVNFSGATAGTVFNWTNNNTSIGLAASGTGNIPSFTAINPTALPVTATITVMPVYTNGGATCTGTATTFTITVNASPTVSPVPSNQIVCNGTTVSPIFFNGPVSGAFYTWTNNQPSIGLGASGTTNTPAFIATNPGTAPVTATITVTGNYTNAGVTCTGPAVSFTITVNPSPSVNAVSSQTLCNGSQTTAVAFSGPIAGTTYTWTNNNTSIGLAAGGSGNISAFTAINNTNAPVIATITVTPGATANGVTCFGTPLSFTITVNPAPAINAVAGQVLCNGSGTSAVNFSSPTAGATFSWTNNNTAIGLGASGTGNIPAFTATNTTNAPITATVTVSTTANGCPGSGTTSFTITVNPTPVVNQPLNQTTCNGSTVAGTTFSGSIAGNVYTWTNSNTSIGLGAGGTGNVPSFTAYNPTTSPVSATITVTPVYTANGLSCTGASKTYTITVNPGANIVFTNAPVRVCLTDTIVNLVATPAGGVWTGPGVVGNTFSASLAGPGVAMLSYTVANGLGCTATSVRNITVNDCLERHNHLNSGIRLYPNPNNGQFYIRFLSDLYKNFDARVIDATGRVYSEYHFTGLVYGQVIPMSLQNLASGTWFLEVYNTADKARIKFVIAR